MGFMIGAAVGAVAGMLFAPKSGEELRGQIKEKASTIKDKATQTAQDKAGVAKDKVGRLADKTRAAVQAGSEAARNV